MLPMPSSSAAIAACLYHARRPLQRRARLNGNNLDQRWLISPLQMIHEKTGPRARGRTISPICTPPEKTLACIEPLSLRDRSDEAMRVSTSSRILWSTRPSHFHAFCSCCQQSQAA